MKYGFGKIGEIKLLILFKNPNKYLKEWKNS